MMTLNKREEDSWIGTLRKKQKTNEMMLALTITLALTLATTIAPTAITPAAFATVAPPATCVGETATITGTPGNDNIVGTPDRDVIQALGGNDRIQGLDGGTGTDSADGGPDSDVCNAETETNCEA